MSDTLIYIFASIGILASLALIILVYVRINNWIEHVTLEMKKIDSLENQVYDLTSSIENLVNISVGQEQDIEALRKEVQISKFLMSKNGVEFEMHAETEDKEV